MTMNNDTTPLPEDIRGTADRLDTLARDDRNAAPVGLDSRLAQLAIDAEPPSVIARIGTTSRLRVAAGLALVVLGTVGTVVLFRTPPVTTDPDAVLIAEAAEAIGDMYASVTPVGTGESEFWEIGLDTQSEDNASHDSLWDLGSTAFSDDQDSWLDTLPESNPQEVL